MSSFDFIIGPEHENERIDKIISSLIPGLTRSNIQKAIDRGGLKINGKQASKNERPTIGAQVSFEQPALLTLLAKPQQINLDIRYEDECLLVVNKPRGMVVHPAAGNHDNTLVNALLHHCKGNLSGINGVIRPGIVHRIDKDTSGLLIVAKNDLAHVSLAEQIKEHSFKREYSAVVYGHFSEPEGKINMPIGRNEKDRKKMCVTQKNSKEAVTNYKVISESGEFSYIKLRLETGRTHQIRVHMSSVGHPVAGDKLYGRRNSSKELDGQCLHAGLIGFIHPKSRQYIEVASELPDYFLNFLTKNGFIDKE